MDFNNVYKKLNGCLREISKVFQEFVKDVSRKF